MHASQSYASGTEVDNVPMTVYIHWRYWSMLDYFVACSGRVPIISVVLGPVVGVSALAAGLADFVIWAKRTDNCSFQARWKLKKPQVVR